VPGSGPVASRVNRAMGRLVGRVVRSLRWKPRSFRRVAAEHGVRLPPRTIEALDADLNLIASLFPVLDQRPLATGEVAVGPVYARAVEQLPERSEEHTSELQSRFELV